VGVSASLTKHCTYCRRPEAEVGKLSYRMMCRDCGNEALIVANIQQVNKRGPVWRKRTERLHAALEREVRALPPTT